MHKKVTSISSRLRTQQREKFEKDQWPNFGIGDFVLLAGPEKENPPKLHANRTGPYTLVETTSNHVYQVEFEYMGQTDGFHF
jgi:hypothetical protein